MPKTKVSGHGKQMMLGDLIEELFIQYRAHGDIPVMITVAVDEEALKDPDNKLWSSEEIYVQRMAIDVKRAVLEIRSFPY